MESRESKNLYKLNQEYLELYYSKDYQKIVNRKHRKLNIKNIFNQLRTGYFFHRIKTMFIPDEANVYIKENYLNEVKADEKIAIYTVIAGNYDGLKEPLYVNSRCDYFVITDQEIPTESIWKKIDISLINEISDLTTNTEKARYVKTHPHILFKEYEYSIFIDGNLLIVADLVPMIEQLGNKSIGIHYHPHNKCVYKEAKDIVALGKERLQNVNRQISQYRSEGFPENYGLFETNVLVRRHNDKECIQLMNEWWNQMSIYTKRDQLSLTYCLWKTEIGVEQVCVLGNNPRTNPRLRYYSHR